jgi:hypothetical protein
MDTFSDGRFSLEVERGAMGSALIHSGNCWKWTSVSADFELRSRNWVEDFGARLSYEYYYSGPQPIEFDRTEVSYANLPGLTWGKKINVLALGVNSSGKPAAGAFVVQPNPANSVIRISSTKYTRPVQATLRNVSGSASGRAAFQGSWPCRRVIWIRDCIFWKSPQGNPQILRSLFSI